MGDDDSCDLLILVLLFRVDEESEIGGIRQQALFARLDGVQQAFTCECVTFENVETAAIEGEIAVVVDPESAQNRTLGRVPERDSLCVNARLQDRHESGLVLADGDSVLEFVFEEIPEFLRLANGRAFFEGLSDFGGVGMGRRRRRDWRCDSRTHAAADATDNSAHLSPRDTAGNAADDTS